MTNLKLATFALAVFTLSIPALAQSGVVHPVPATGGPMGTHPNPISPGHLA